MDSRAEVRDFLTTRRARITPAQAGLPTYGTHRRVAGLRREEVAMLAGISVDYYTRLEQGRERRPSDQVLNALGRALGLDDAAVLYIYELAYPRPHPRPTRRRGQVSPGVMRLLNSWDQCPAYV